MNKKIIYNAKVQVSTFSDARFDIQYIGWVQIQIQLKFDLLI